MPKASPHLVEQFARTHERDVKRTLQRHYGAKLSSEDISDVLQDTYVAASVAVAGEKGPRDLSALRMWFYGAVRHKAIDAIRGVEGRRYTRDRDVSYDALTEQGAGLDPLTADEHAESLDRVDGPVKAQDVALVHDAFHRLSTEHRELLRLTDMDEDPRSLRDAAALLGKSKSELARQRSRALCQLSVLIAKAKSSDCLKARSLATTKVFGDSLAWRDVHLADCLGCQVSYGRRVQVLLPFLPLAMPGRLARAGNTLASVFGRGDVPEAAAAGVAAAGSGLAGAGFLGDGGAAKLAACAAAGVTAVACVALVTGEDTDRDARAPRAAAAAPASGVPLTTASPLARDRLGRPELPAKTVSGRSPVARERRTDAARARRSPGATDEFAPEAFTPTVQAPLASTSAQASFATPERASPASPDGSDSGFSQEFAP